MFISRIRTTLKGFVKICLRGGGFPSEMIQMRNVNDQHQVMVIAQFKRKDNIQTFNETNLHYFCFKLEELRVC